MPFVGHGADHPATVEPGGAIAGTVTDASTHAPINGATVTAYDSGGHAVGTDTSDADGHYKIDALPVGSYSVGFVAGGYVAQYYDHKASLATADPVAVKLGAATEAVNAGLAAAATSHVLNVLRAGSGSGTVTSYPIGISCGTICSHAYAGGTTVTLAAKAAPGSTVAGWSAPCPTK
ncbi:MAG TPA: carboxypeptidase-like regulatory domain-containing protein, partial [Mycobacteriales bacterium]|nr:carboxypeptidase-like regulatory domain-containing protein [Mycobacteriales bacterium]